MIRKFISRVFGRSAPSRNGEASVIPHAKHGIARDAISSGSRRTAVAISGRRGGAMGLVPPLAAEAPQR